MENINIEKSDNSPKVIMDAQKGFIEFDGKSYPENTFEFYEPILEWLKEYFTNKKETIVNIKLTYFNSATTQILFDILDVIQDSQHKSVNINWYYDSEDEHGMEDFEDYSDEFPDLNINAIAF